MEWDDLRIALAIARSGGLAGAARTLGVNHATVWRRLKALEAQLDTRLFERRPEGYVPTAAGDELRRAAEAMEEAADGLDRRLSGRDARLTGTVRLSTLDPVAINLVPPHLARFRDLHPGILIELTVGTALANLTRRDADIVLRAAVAPSETLVGRRLADVTMAAYAAPSYLARSKAGADWAKHDWIAPDEIFAHTSFYKFIARESGGRIAMRADSEPALAAIAAAGIGATLLPCFTGDADPRLVRLAPPIPELTHGLWLLTHEDLRGSARIRAVLDFLASAIRSERARLAGEHA
ncbi:MAG: LysR family transcriptional regulator [Alphaproteobacteria bacterium]|nr:LysR family transcriptional regulator [Alphaproteobacteria bacterium]